jgi:hypothetical protein
LNAAALASLGRDTFPKTETHSDAECLDRAWQLILAAVAMALIEVGWTPHTGPGEEIVLRRGGDELRPFSEMSAVVDGRVAADAWSSRLAALGIAETRLGKPLIGVYVRDAR